jgi:hypothetical protein
MITLAVDCMGGDHGPSVTLPACHEFLQSHADAHLLLIGLPESLKDFSHPRATLIMASEVVTMEDSLEFALRRKKDSSMRLAIQQVKDGAAQAAVIERLPDGEQLLRDDREHLEVDAVELVEARPRPSLRQAGEELFHHLVVQAIRAVEHYTRHRERFREILDTLRLSGSRRSGWRAAQE